MIQPEPLESLGGAGGWHDLSFTMRQVLDVMYEAGEPLDADAIASRTRERASGAQLGHAQRIVLRDRQRWQRRRTGVDPLHARALPTSNTAWPPYIRGLLRQAVRRGIVLREEDRYWPNPDKPGWLGLPDGSRVRYTREAWRTFSAQDRATREVDQMRLEADRLLGPLGREELEQAIAMVVGYTQRYKERAAPMDPRSLRARIRYLLERPTTDEARAWLLHELVRRAYE